jgi:3-oxoacyl-[acyl-carrier protein] reductase
VINPMDMTGRTVLVTGASSGIGRETAILLSQMGARLVLVARSADQLAATQAQLDGTGHYVEPFDLANVGQIPGELMDLARRCGPLGALVHSAGVQKTVPLKVLEEEHLAEVMKVNLNAAVALAKGFRQKKVAAPGGSIVFVSSVAGLVGVSGASAYSASKGALIALTKSLAAELSREGIRVNCVAPGYVRTEMMQQFLRTVPAEQLQAIESMHLLGLGHPRDVANAIAFLLADTARWITGTVLVVDGGYTAR